jgi:hypothetical protein
MKKNVLFTFVFFFLVCAPAIFSQSGENTNQKKKSLPGTWKLHDFTYVFESSGAMKAGKRDGKVQLSNQYHYRWIKMGMHDCLIFEKDSADSLSAHIMLVGEVTDSTAVLSLAAPFIRKDPGENLCGSWKYAQNMTRIEWTFGPDSLEYRETLLDLFTGYERIIESSRGSYSNLSDSSTEAGSYEVTFQNGKSAVILPVVYKNLMYLFDLSRRKSFFVRDTTAPSLAANKGKARM